MLALVPFFGRPPPVGPADGVSAADAKSIYRGCFKLANAKVVRINGKPITR